MTQPDFESSGGTLQEFDDGHIPEQFVVHQQLESTEENDGGLTRKSTAAAMSHSSQDPVKTTAPTRLVHYPHFFSKKPSNVHIFHDALPTHVVDSLYERTVQQQIRNKTPWGAYVTMKQIEDFWIGASECKSDCNNCKDSDLVLIETAARFMKLALGERSPTVRHSLNDRTSASDMNSNRNVNMTQDGSDEALWDMDVDFPMAHGVAIWALASSQGSQVPYHLDYAEQIRYDTNYIVPPLLAGTLHCTRTSIKGGAFRVALKGLDHYHRHGYKCKKMELSSSPDEDGMVEIPYRYNQITCHPGHLPHSSTLVESIEDENLMRVMVGFNVFAHDIGPLVQQAPEHSDAFRRQVQLRRKFLLLSNKYNSGSSDDHSSSSSNPSKRNHLSLESIRQSKPLTKLLVLAKREKVKQEFQQAKESLKSGIPEMLPATVQSLMDTFSNKENRDKWPQPVDVQVYLHHQVKEGALVILESATAGAAGVAALSQEPPRELISPLAILGETSNA